MQEGAKIRTTWKIPFFSRIFFIVKTENTFDIAKVFEFRIFPSIFFFIEKKISFQLNTAPRVCPLLIFNEFVIAHIYRKMQNEHDIYLLFKYLKEKKERKKKKKYGATVIISRFRDAAILLTVTFWNVCMKQMKSTINNEHTWWLLHVYQLNRNDVIKTSKIYIQKKKGYKVWFVIKITTH